MSRVVSFTLFGFETTRAKAWALGQMAVAKRQFRRIPGLEFFKLMGTGAGAGFSARPDFGTFTFFGVWPGVNEARNALENAPVHQRYLEQAGRFMTFFLEPVSARGSWDGYQVPVADGRRVQHTPVVALTRATIRPECAFSFWRHVSAISDQAERDAAQCFMIGTGELPWVRQVTFSIWTDEDAMQRFSLDTPNHGVAARKAYAENWFAESCFARFNLMDMVGAWPGAERIPFSSLSAAANRAASLRDQHNHTRETPVQ
ncbi:spheroidene monooxygenase [Roseibium sp. RKSG952]|uniref:spheroidene monooxygenase n=1 Tax=Roseibium sp. RKSG952 TaxID=2529384 RepID=UPI0012BB7AB3|nr:spheroidene monooxygenase [Roseibium sp. RKSG952]MTH98786.1 spheroidene monooxygenase [Roseibium sp. RKSG952]